MATSTLFTLFFLCSFSLYAQIGSVPGTLNQVQPDPAVQDFEQDYGQLKKTVKDLDRPVKKKQKKKKTI